MKKFILTVGLNDKDTLTQLIPTDTAKDKILMFISMFTDGATLSEKVGFYRHENNELTHETCIQIELTLVKKSVVMKIIKVLKNYFNQETILLEILTTNSKLI